MEERLPRNIGSDRSVVPTIVLNLPGSGPPEGSEPGADRRRERVTVKAYVLIQAELGALGRLADEVAVLPGVRWVERVTGPYDLIAGVESGADGVPALVPRIQELGGVIRALTSLVVDGSDDEGPGELDRPRVVTARA
jgi:hypothetical protein